MIVLHGLLLIHDSVLVVSFSLSPNTSELEEMFMLQTSYRNKIYYSDRKVRVYLVNLLGII